MFDSQVQPRAAFHADLSLKNNDHKIQQFPFSFAPMFTFLLAKAIAAGMPR